MPTLSNEKMRMEFDAEGRLAALADDSGKVVIPIDAAAVTSAFKIVLRRATGETVAVTPQAPPRVQAEPRSLRCQWEVSGEWGRLEVEGRVELPEDSELSAWTLGIKNHTRLAIWEVVYPRVSGLMDFPAVDGSPGELAAPHWSGQLVPSPVAVVNGPDRQISDWMRGEYAGFDIEGGANLAYSYPGVWIMQVLAYGHPRSGGIYFAAHDGQALYKAFGLYRDGDDGKHAALTMKQYPEDRLAAGADFASFYPAMVGVYRGPWWGATAIYRQWATRQLWCRKGPTRDRADISSKSKQLDLWYWNYTFTTDSRPCKIVPMIRHLRERIGCNLGFHWYSFNGEMFHRWRVPWGPPENEDILAILRNALRELHELGVLVIPYLDCRIWSSETLSFQRADGMKWIAQDAEGQGLTWPGTKAWTMCPTAPPFHNLTTRLVGELIDKCGLDGAYLDQVTSCNAVPCFNKDHDHPPGGHDHWVRGYRVMLERIQSEIKRRAPTNIITSEGYIECFLDLFDLDLGYTLNLFWQALPGSHPIPMSQSVYHDYHMTYGSMNKFPTTDLPMFRYCDALLLVGGGQLGVCGAFAGDERHPPYKEKFEFVEALARAHMAGRQWFNLGVWRPPLSLECERVAIEQKNPKGVVLQTLSVPAVLSGCFELDGELCVALVNHTAAERHIRFTLDPAAYGMVGQPRTLRVIHPQTEASAPVAGVVSRELILPPCSVRLMTLG